LVAIEQRRTDAAGEQGLAPHRPYPILSPGHRRSRADSRERSARVTGYGRDGSAPVAAGERRVNVRRTDAQTTRGSGPAFAGIPVSLRRHDVAGVFGAMLTPEAEESASAFSERYGRASFVGRVDRLIERPIRARETSGEGRARASGLRNALAAKGAGIAVSSGPCPGAGGRRSPSGAPLRAR
jgi:hypothetical protein